MATVTVVIRDTELVAFLNRMGGDTGAKALGQAFVAEGQIIMRESRRRVPLDTGVLRASGQVLPLETSAGRVTLRMGYGGAAEKYALIQHDTLNFNHAPGRTALYLLEPVQERIPAMGDAITERLRLMLMAKGG